MNAAVPRPSTPIEVKICGLTRLEDARAALEAGADFLGFVFYPPSPRAVLPEQVRRILERLGSAARAIGVFVNTPPDAVLETARACGLYAVQLHGEERPADYAGFPMPLWRAVRFAEGKPMPDPDVWPAARYVADAFSSAAADYGGTGKTADWEAAARLAAKRPIMLAGGLTPLNVAAAIERVRPLGVDVAGGVESAPGIKDHGLLRAFVRAAKTGEEKT